MSPYFRSAEYGTQRRSSSSLSLICSSSMCSIWHTSILQTALTENISFILMRRDHNNHVAATWVIIIFHFQGIGASRDVPNRLLGCWQLWCCAADCWSASGGFAITKANLWPLADCERGVLEATQSSLDQGCWSLVSEANVDWNKRGIVITMNKEKGKETLPLSA